MPGKAREVISICVGQAGIQLGNTIWKQYLAEHSIGADGSTTKPEEASPTFFTLSDNGQAVPRNAYFDLEPTVLDEVRTGCHGQLHNPESLINGMEDAANNFARGHYTVGKELSDKCEAFLRKMVDNCQNVQGFFVSHSVGGGTGSGLGALLLEKIAVEYRKKSKIGFEIYPSPNISTCIVEPYNALLSTHWLLDHTDVSLLLDNEALYEICQKSMDIERPSYGQLNMVITKVISSMTTALRFTGELNVDLNEFQTNLVPFPRLHFMTTSLAPLLSEKKKSTATATVQQITDNCFQAKNFLIKYEGFDVAEDKYMAISLNYRGEVKSKDANATAQWLKQNNKVTFVDWCPTGFKIGLNDTNVPKLGEEDLMASVSKSVVMIGNNTAVSRVFTKRVNEKFDMMYAQRAYVHWYVGEGMEEGEFGEAREDVGFLEKDYADVLSEQNSDEVEESDDM
jgi:tubulin alpha